MTGSVERNPFYLLVEQAPEPVISVGSSALVVVDMDNFDVNPNYGIGARAKRAGIYERLSYYWQSVGEILPRIQELLEACRRVGLEIIYTRVGEITVNSRDAGRRHRARGTLVPISSHEARIIDELAPKDDEIVIVKSCSGAFNGTSLDRILRNMRIDTLIITGVVTHGCVEMTARVAADLGYDVILVSDACATMTPQLQMDALERMDDGYICIKTAKEVVARIKSLSEQEREV